MQSFLGDPFRKCPRIQRCLVRQWILVASVYSLCLATEIGTPFSDEEVAALVVFNGGMAGFAGYDAPRAVLAFHSVFCSFVGRPKIFGIVVDVDWKRCASPWRSHRCSSWTSLTCPLCSETGTFSAVCVQTVEIPQVQFLVMFLTCPLLCMSRSSTSPSWRRGRFPWFSEQTTSVRRPGCAGSWVQAVRS